MISAIISIQNALVQNIPCLTRNRFFIAADSASSAECILYVSSKYYNMIKYFI